MSKGIIIVAVGHPYYSRLAYNLALTIKAVEKDFPIAVVQSRMSMEHLSATQKQIFDHIIDLPDDAPIGCGSKLWAYQLSPFKETLLLDADMVWLPKKSPSELFNEVKDVDFTGITEGYWTKEESDINARYFFWAKPEEIAKVYKTDNKIYQWRSEVVYFKKNALISKFFKLAQKVFLKPGLSTIGYYAQGVADELGFNVSAAVHNIHPHVYKWQVSYWDRMNGMRMPPFDQMYSCYYLASFGSKDTTGEAKKFYDRIVKAACFKLGIQHIFPLYSKREYLPERQKM